MTTMNRDREGRSFKKRNYKPAIIIISTVLILAIGVLAGMPGYEDFDAFDVTMLPLLNAVFNTFTFAFLFFALLALIKKNVTLHRRLMYAALTSTTLLSFSFLPYHFLAR